jgi:hypothetical protein
MERKIINVNGNEYEFINKASSTRNGFKHESWLFINGIERDYNKINYNNRTWENYTYQMCMLGVMYVKMDDRLQSLKENFKELKGISRLTKKYQEEFDKYVDNDILYKEYEEVRRQLRGKVW